MDDTSPSKFFCIFVAGNEHKERGARSSTRNFYNTESTGVPKTCIAFLAFLHTKTFVDSASAQRWECLWITFTQKSSLLSHFSMLILFRTWPLFFFQVCKHVLGTGVAKRVEQTGVLTKLTILTINWEMKKNSFSTCADYTVGIVCM